MDSDEFEKIREDAARFDEQRLETLLVMYREAEGVPKDVFKLQTIRDKVDFDKETFRRIHTRLRRDGLVEHVHNSPTAYALTPPGAAVAEAALAAPDDPQPAYEFPAAKNVLVVGEAKNTQIQQGTRDSVQISSVEEVRPALEDFVDVLERLGSEIESDGEVLGAHATILKTEAEATEPNPELVAGSTRTVRGRLKELAATGAISGATSQLIQEGIEHAGTILSLVT